MAAWDEEYPGVEPMDYGPRVPGLLGRMYRNPYGAAPPPLDDPDLAAQQSHYAPAQPAMKQPSAAASPNLPSLPTGPRPQWEKDFKPPERHGIGKFAANFFSMWPAGHQYFYEAPEARAKQNYQTAVSEYEAPFGERAKEAETEERQAQAENQRAEAEERRNPQPKVGTAAKDITLHDLMTGNNGQPRTNPKTGNPYQYLEAYQATEEAGQKPSTDNQTQRKEAIDKITAKLDKAGLPTDPKSLGKSLDRAKQQGIITSDEHAAVTSYQTTDATPSTNLTVHVAGAEAGANIKDEHGFYAYNGKIVRGTQLTPEQRDAALPVKNPEEAAKSIHGTNSVLNAFGRYQDAIEHANLSQQDVRALQVLTSPGAIAHSFFAKEVAGVWDAVFGQPLTGYSQKAFEGMMTKDQYDKLSPDGQKLLINYFNAVIANFADMKARLGSIGRNESMIQAELHTIPLPYIGKDQAREGLTVKTNDVASRNIYFGQAAQSAGGNQRRVIDLTH